MTVTSEEQFPSFIRHMKLSIKDLEALSYIASVAFWINHRICNSQNCNRLQWIGTDYCILRHHLCPIGWYLPFEFLLHCSHHYIFWSCILLLNSIMIFKNRENLSSGKVISFTIVKFSTPRCLARPNSFVISILITMVLELILLILS